MKTKAFTLVELLMVISIIILIVSITVIMLPNLKPSGLKGSAILVRTAFSRTRQLASSERLMYFIYFIPDKGIMLLHKDTDEDSEFNQDNDERVGQPVRLSPEIIFASGTDGPPIFDLDIPYVGFRRDGSIKFPDGVEDLSMGNPPSEETSDIILINEKDRPGKIFLDIEGSGIIRKIYYQPE